MLRRLSPLLALSVSTSCAKTEFVRQMPGPERVLDRRVAEDRAQGPMVLELEDDGALPGGTISGRVYRDTTCTAVREVEAERTVTTKQRSKGGIANVVGGVLLSAAGIGILAAAQRQSDRPKGDDELRVGEPVVGKPVGGLAQHGRALVDVAAETELHAESQSRTEQVRIELDGAA